MDGCDFVQSVRKTGQRQRESLRFFRHKNCKWLADGEERVNLYMHAIARKQALKDAFKRYQRLPELPAIEAGDHRSMQSFMDIPLVSEAVQSSNADEGRPTEVLAD